MAGIIVVLVLWGCDDMIKLACPHLRNEWGGIRAVCAFLPDGAYAVGIPGTYDHVILSITLVASGSLAQRRAQRRQVSAGAARAALIPTLDQSLRPRRPVAEPLLTESKRKRASIAS